jgi:AbrB family looped-hinge helix DNA binding protein
MTGDTTRVEDKGRVVIPAVVRRRLGIKPGTELEVDVRDGGIVMKPRRLVTAKDLLGAAGKERVRIKEIEESLADE